MEISEQDLFDGVQHLGRVIWISNDNATWRRVNPAKRKILRFSSTWHLWKLILPYNKGLRKDLETYELYVLPKTK